MSDILTSTPTPVRERGRTVEAFVFDPENLPAGWTLAPCPASEGEWGIYRTQDPYDFRYVMPGHVIVATRHPLEISAWAVAVEWTSMSPAKFEQLYEVAT